jgi:SAM-dependent methyltransferase
MYFLKREKCPCCGGNSFQEIYNAPYQSEQIKDYLKRFYIPQGNPDLTKLNDIDYSLITCLDCTFIFQRYIPNDFLMKELYEVWLDTDKTFDLFERNYTIDYYKNYFLKIYRYINLFKQKPSDIQVYDFGMGWGNWASLCKSFGCSVYGGELSERRIEIAKSKGIENLNLNDTKPNQFDFINTDQVFEHLSDPLPILNKLVKCLKPGGFIRISVPDAALNKKNIEKMDWSAPVFSNDSIHIVSPLEHINAFNNKSLITLASKAGLKPFYSPDHPKVEFEDNAPTNTQKINKGVSLIKQGTINSIRSIAKKFFPTNSTIKHTGTDLLFVKA